MIEIVINYNKDRREFNLYEPTTDTLLITSSLGETFIKLNEFLQSQGMITTDILGSTDIMYHIDSLTFLALVESNAGLIKQLNNAPSGFMISSQRFGMSNTMSTSPKQQAQGLQQGKGNSNYYDGKKKRGKTERGSSGFFSNSSFRGSYKKFGGQ